MDPDTEVLFNYPSLFRIYKSGRVERAPKTTTAIPASFDPATGVTSKDLAIDPEAGVTARLYLPAVSHNPKLPLVIYFHGGAFCVYSPSSPIYHRYINSLASRARLAVLSVGYRLAPENLLPAGYDDSWAAVNWALSDAWLAERCDYGRVFLAGDSAGGNIAHQMAMRIGGGGLGATVRVEGMALVHPFFWGRDPVGPETRDARVREFIEEIWRVVNAPGADADDPRINPTAGRGAPSLAGVGCERAIVCVAEKDALVERGRAYAEALRASGWDGEVELVESPGEGHCFHLDDPQGAEAVELMNRLVGFFNRVGR